MRVSIVAALAANGVIGRQGRLPWGRLPADIRFFKELTLGHTVVMGRKTYDSIRRPLPGRRNIVITRRTDWAPPGVEVVHSLAEALAAATAQGPDDEVFVVGGAEIYAEALPIVDRLYLTRIAADFPGDTRFPEIDAADWRRVAQEPHEASDENPYAFTFEILDRA